MTSEGFRRKLTAILSADVAGYSRLMAEDESATVKTLETYREVMSTLIKQHRGRVIDSPGDNLLAEFTSVVDAVQCAVAVQKEFQARNVESPENRRMEFRIGVNLGDVIEEGDRIYGDGVNIAARLEALADPGGICVSKTAFDHIESKLPLGYEYLGEQPVKNIPKPVGAYRVLMEPRITVAEEIEKEKAVPLWRRKSILAGGVALIVLVIAALIWNFYFKAPPMEVAAVERMAHPLPDKPSIAVMPFLNISGDPTQEYLSDGLTENVITTLARVPYIFVIARNSTFAYKGKGVKIQQVSEELGVQYILEGSVQRSGDKVRVTAQLIDALKGHHMWVAQYDRELKDLFQLIDEVTVKILGSVTGQLKGSDVQQLQDRLGRRTPMNAEIILKTWEAVETLRVFNVKENRRAKRLAEECIAMDPEWPAGYTILAATHFMDVWLRSTDSPRNSLVKARELAEKSIALDEFHPSPYNVLGHILSLMRQHDKALAVLEKAVELCPSCADSYAFLGMTLNYVGEWDKSVSALKTAIRLNPIPPAFYFLNLGNAYREAGKYEEAIPSYERCLQMQPNNQMAYLGLAITYNLQGREKEAEAAAKEVLRLNPKFALEPWGKSLPYSKEVIARNVEALKKAGLK
jgi:adenylate cyclase